jgi:thymidylate synthase ThyX
MQTSVEVLADSISPDNVRLTTLLCIYPRFIHSEMLRHRMFSHSVASSRAIPTEKNIQQVRNDPFVPTTFNKRVKGMGVGDPLEVSDQEEARNVWVDIAAESAFAAERLNEIGIDKSRANRLLEPFLYVTDIITATEWDNFFALRDHPAAQPEFQELAAMMKRQITWHIPEKLNYGQWHLPLVSDVELEHLCEARKTFFAREAIENIKMISASRCARVSFDKHTEFETINNTLERAQRLIDSGHLSPFEHVARPMEREDTGKVIGECSVAIAHLDFCGNFRGWVQMRKEIANEDNFALLVEKEIA